MKERGKKIKHPSVQLDFFESEKRKNEGMEQAVENANHKKPGWQDKAYAFLVEWLYKQPPKHRFLLEDVRAAAHKRLPKTDEQKEAEELGEPAVPDPPDNRAWGIIAVMAKKDKLMKGIGYGNCVDVKGHRHPVTIWQKI